MFALEQVYRELTREDKHGAYSVPDQSHWNAVPGEFQGDAHKGGVPKVSNKPNAYKDLVPVDGQGFRIILIFGETIWIQSCFMQFKVQIYNFMWHYESFLSIHFCEHEQQDISNAFDEAARKYIDEIDPEDRTDAEITAVMREAARAKAASYKGKFSKYTAIANPKLGD